MHKKSVNLKKQRIKKTCKSKSRKNLKKDEIKKQNKRKKKTLKYKKIGESIKKEL